MLRQYSFVTGLMKQRVLVKSIPLVTCYRCVSSDGHVNIQNKRYSVYKPRLIHEIPYVILNLENGFLSARKE